MAEVIYQNKTSYRGVGMYQPLPLCEIFWVKLYKGESKAIATVFRDLCDLTGKIDKIGVLCSWYTPSTTFTELSVQSSSTVTRGAPHEIPITLSLCMHDRSHTFWPVSTYICSLPYGCFEPVEEDVAQHGFIANGDLSLSL